MSIERHHLTVGGLPVEIVRKGIKNLHLGVYPPDGRIRVAAPLRVSNEAVRLAVIGKLGWIKRQRARFTAQPRETRRQMVEGETHYFLGRRYRLRTIEHDAAPKVFLRPNARLVIYARPALSAEQRERVLQQWYREQFKAIIPPLVKEWQERLGVELGEWGIKRMKTRWGSCSVKARRVWLNLELVKKPRECIEYILAHELIHLLEPTHNDRFIALMNRALPKWQFHRQTLNSLPVRHETWAY